MPEMGQPNNSPAYDVSAIRIDDKDRLEDEAPRVPITYRCQELPC